jgi:hypothetical protein
MHDNGPHAYPCLTTESAKKQIAEWCSLANRKTPKPQPKTPRRTVHTTPNKPPTTAQQKPANRPPNPSRSAPTDQATPKTSGDFPDLLFQYQNNKISYSKNTTNPAVADPPHPNHPNLLGTQPYPSEANLGVPAPLIIKTHQNIHPLQQPMPR